MASDTRGATEMVTDVATPSVSTQVEMPPADAVANLPWRVRFGYGGAEAVGTGTWSLFYTFFLFFLTDTVGISAATGGTLVMLGTIFVAVATPFSGVYSDTRKWKAGRRRPFLLLAALPLGVSFWLMFTDPHLSGGWLIAYYVVVVLVFNTAWAFEQTPYTALAAEMTQDYDERTSLVTYRSGWSAASSFLTFAAPLVLVGYFSGLFGSDSAGWSAMAALIVALTLLPLLYTWYVTRGRELYRETTALKWRDLLGTLRNRSFRYVAGMFATVYCMQTVFSMVLVYYGYFVMGWDDNRLSAFFTMFVAVALVSVVVVNRVALWVGKAHAMAFWNVVAVLAALGTIFTGPGNEYLFWILGAVMVVGTMAGTLLTWAMIPDCTEVDEFKTGNRREGLYYGIAVLLQQLAVAAVAWLVGHTLTWTGFVSSADTQTAGAVEGIRYLLAGGVAVFAIVTMVLALRMPLTRAKHKALVEAIEMKQEGHEVDTSPFADVL